MAAISVPQTSVDARITQEMKQTVYYTSAWLDVITEIWCWRRLPLQVAAPLGDYLYKHLG
jgi:hypothetical protein